MSLDTVENPPKLRESGNSPAIMPKGGETPAPEPDENIVQPEPNGAPVRSAKTVFRRDSDQALATRVAELEQQLAEERREKAELQRQLAQAQAKQARQRAKANERQKHWREQNPEVARARSAESMRKKRARERGQHSSK